jgi:DNA-binding LacI/PurR family transcriptional regulator
LVRSPGGPTVIWSNSHLLAPILLEALAIADIGIPTDCSFVTFGDSSWAAAYRPTISVITDHLDAVATALTSSVLHQLGVTGSEPPVEVPRGAYLARKSVAPPASSDLTGGWQRIPTFNPVSSLLQSGAWVGTRRRY